MKHCPNGYLTEDKLVDIYSQFFPLGNCKMLSQHIFSSIVQYSLKTAPLNSKQKKVELNFCQFITTLSVVVKGTLDEKIRWLFYYYDLNCNGNLTSKVFLIFNLSLDCIKQKKFS